MTCTCDDDVIVEWSSHGFSLQIVETVDVIGGDYLWQVCRLC